MSRHFAAFVLIGALAAVLNIGARVVANQFVSYDVAIVIAFFIALSFAFSLNRTYVFRHADGPLPQQFSRFLFVNLLALVQVWAISVGLARFLFPVIGFEWHAKTVAHAIGVVSPVVTSYFLHKHFSFAARPDQDSEKVAQGGQW